ncbi:MAG: hypothetical protein LBT59_07710, partial [Clostridiales bacterium]|nr:hypothetical protein [Clostridiales bacterium]
RYFLTTIADIHTASWAIKSHWNVENRVHWTLDVIFDDDKCKVTAKHGGEFLTSIRRACVTMFTFIYAYYSKEYAYDSICDDLERSVILGDDSNLNKYLGVLSLGLKL